MSTRLKITFIILALCAGVLLVRIVFLFKTDLETSATISNALRQNSLPENPFLKDSDGDGVSDRDEIIYGTDPLTKDTDGDGYVDGEEIISQRDPLDSSSNDGSGGLGISALSPTANLTDRLLNVGLASLLNDEGLLDPDQMTAQKFADVLGTVEEEATIYFTLTALTDEDIRVIEDNSPERIRKYLSALTPIVEEGLFSSGSKVLGDVLTGVPDASYYEKTYHSLKTLEVPSSWKEIHKSALHSFLRLTQAFKAMADINTDPVRATFALDHVQDSFFELNALINQAARLAQSQNIPLQDSIIQTIQSSGASFQR